MAKIRDGNRNPRVNRVVWAAAAVLLGLVGRPQLAAAAPPATVDLLPKNTLAYLSISDTTELAEKAMQTSIGRMSQDPQLKPLVEQLYGTLMQATGEAQQELGMPFSELLKLPQGEVALAVVPSPLPPPAEGDTEQAPTLGPPAVILFIDAGDRISTLRELVDTQMGRLEETGAARVEQKLDDTTLVVFEFGGQPRAAYFERDGAIVFGSNVDSLKALLAAWNGGKAESLSQNQEFSAIMSRSRGSADERPQAVWFVDPINIYRAASSGNAGARLGLAILPTLGLDGLMGIGGSITMAGAQFDMVVHAHVLLDTPRAGVIEVLALGSGDVAPERWVPADAASYSTIHWDLNKSFKEIGRLYDSFQGQGSFADLVAGAIFEVSGLDFERDILPDLAGRASLTAWYERPVTIASQVTLAGIEIKDPERFGKTLEKIVAHYEGQVEKRDYAGKTYYEVNADFGPAVAPDGTEIPRPRPCFALVDNYLLLSDRTAGIERAIATGAGDADQTLAEQLDYKLIAGTIRKQAASPPGFVTFERPEEALRFVYELASSEQTQGFLQQQATNNPFFQGVNQALKDNPLPPFEILAQYLAPGGSILTDDETGFHYVSFTLKRDQP